MKMLIWLTALTIGLIFSLHAQLALDTPYRGFYHLNIPGLVWNQGTQFNAQFGEKSGYLNIEDVKNPLFICDDGSPVPLLLSQANRLIMVISPGKHFTIWGIEGKVSDHERTPPPFFVPLGAIINGRKLDLIPTEPVASEPTKPSGPSGPPGGPGMGKGPGSF